MVRTRSLAAAAAAACLASAAGSAAACQLSLSGTVIQQPLTYNPFQAGAATAEVSFTVHNAGAKPCDAAFAFFRLGGLQAQAEGSAALNYQMLGSSGPAVLGTASPPATLPGPSALAHFTVGAKQDFRAQAMISAADGQVVGPGIYKDQLTLGIYRREADGGYRKAVDAPVSVTVAVNSQMTLAVAGGGRQTTLNFGEFVEGATRSVQLLAYSNQGFRLAASSDNTGVLKPIDAAAAAAGSRVPYTIAFNGTPPVDLSQNGTISLGRGATTKTGLAIPIEVHVGSMKGQRAGLYRDVITIAIDPGF